MVKKGECRNDHRAPSQYGSVDTASSQAAITQEIDRGLGAPHVVYTLPVDVKTYDKLKKEFPTNSTIANGNLQITTGYSHIQ